MSPVYVYWDGKKEIALEEHVFSFMSKWTQVREKVAFLKPFCAQWCDTKIVVTG